MNYDWVEPTLARIADILRMPGRHNSYGVPKVSPLAAWAAIKLIWPLTNPYTPPPIVYPDKEGGLEFIFSGRETVVTVQVLMDGKLTVNCVKGAVPRIFGDFGVPEQFLEEGLRQIDMELDPARSEAPKP